MYAFFSNPWVMWSLVISGSSTLPFIILIWYAFKRWNGVMTLLSVALIEWFALSVSKTPADRFFVITMALSLPLSLVCDLFHNSVTRMRKKKKVSESGKFLMIFCFLLAVTVWGLWNFNSRVPAWRVMLFLLIAIPPLIFCGCVTWTELMKDVRRYKHQKNKRKMQGGEPDTP